MGEALTEIPQFYKTEFSTNWETELQQMLSRLKDHATVASVNGKEKKFNVFGAQSMSRKTERSGQTKRSDVVLDEYWVRPLPYELANLFDEYDEEFLGDIILPKSETVQSHVMAYYRACDNVIIDALGGTRYSGESGTVSNALTQNVAVNWVKPGDSPANVGLTLPKLIKAKSILGKAEAIEPGDELIFAYTQQQLDDLLNNVAQVSDADYNNVKALVTGELDHFMGFKFVRLEGLALSGADVRTCFAYVKSGIKFADSGRRSYMDILPAESHSLQIRTTASMGASRTREAKVVAVYCDESP